MQMTRLEVLKSEALKSELSAIDCLDRFYWQTEDPDRNEKLGYLVRQDRRRELITELLKAMHERKVETPM